MGCRITLQAHGQNDVRVNSKAIMARRLWSLRICGTTWRQQRLIWEWNTRTYRISAELEKIQRLKQACPFPPACRAILINMEGNATCIDCGRNNPEWAAVSYGALVCLYCSGNHRSLGVNVSTVRSITMDHWSADEILKVLEGGNRQLHTFYQGHSLYLDSSTPQ